MSDRKCCYLEGGKAEGQPCGSDAEWELYGSNEPREPVDACTKHVGYLLDDAPATTVFPIREQEHDVSLEIPSTQGELP